MIDEERKVLRLRNTQMVRGRALTETNNRYLIQSFVPMGLYIKREKNWAVSNKKMS